MTLALLLAGGVAATAGHQDGATIALTLCPAAQALEFVEVPIATASRTLELKAKPGTCIVIGGAPCAGHGCLIEGSCASAPKWKTAPAPGGTGVQVRTGGICIDFFNQDKRLQAYNCCASSACVNQHYEVDAASKSIFSTGQGAMAVFKNMSLCMHSIPPPSPPPPPPGPPAPKSALWCPQYHEIQGHYDPSGPILINGTWHVFPDGSTAPGNGWSHFTSTDLLRWERQVNSTVAGGDTGSVSLTDNGDIVALYPDNDPNTGGRALFRQTPTQNGGTGKLGLNVQWSQPSVSVDKPPSLGKGMRDPARALKMPDGHWYVGAGSGFGGTGPNSNNNTGLPSSGTGCLAWFRAKDETLSSFDYIGCLLENNHTTGYIDPATTSWKPTDRVSAFFECPGT